MPPNILIAFIVVLLIWSTTPLAVQWSAENWPLSSVTLRMLIGCAFCSVLLLITKVKLPFDSNSRNIFIIAGLATFGGMSLVYLAAQSIPSGWIAILFGLSPLFTGLIAAYVEPETRLTKTRIIGIILGLVGLTLVFQAGLSLSGDYVPGIVMMLVSVLISSSSSVYIRHLSQNSHLTAVQTTVGSLIVALPLFALISVFNEPITSIDFSKKETLSILYLGLVGTGIGFTLYYYLLKRLTASKVALVTLITPITALLVGNIFNNEPVLIEVWFGAGFVCLGLFLYEYKPRFGLQKL